MKGRIWTGAIAVGVGDTIEFVTVGGGEENVPRDAGADASIAMGVSNNSYWGVSSTIEGEPAKAPVTVAGGDDMCTSLNSVRAAVAVRNSISEGAGDGTMKSSEGTM